MNGALLEGSGVASRRAHLPRLILRHMQRVPVGRGDPPRVPHLSVLLKRLPAEVVMVHCDLFRRRGGISTTIRRSRCRTAEELEVVVQLDVGVAIRIGTDAVRPLGTSLLVAAVALERQWRRVSFHDTAPLHEVILCLVHWQIPSSSNGHRDRWFTVDQRHLVQVHAIPSLRRLWAPNIRVLLPSLSSRFRATVLLRILLVAF